MMLSMKSIAISCLLVSGLLASAWPQRPQYAKILERAEEVQDEYDYVIVGGGTSGLTVGDRLTENGKYSVLVIEYGLYHSQTGMHPSRMFNITSKPSPILNNRQFSVGLGCAVGGSSCVNGQVLLRGTKEEYNAWKALGGPDSTWDWEGLLPYFKKGITLIPPPEEIASEFNISYNQEYWGTKTPIYATFGNGSPQGILKTLYSAMAAMPGMNVAEDSGSGENGVYWYTTSMDPERFQRSYARTGHWDGLNRENYKMIVGAKVNNILFDDDLAATGVQFTSVNGTGAEATTVKARREVILAAGTIHTPQVLMLSGVGPKTLLDEAGIDVKIDLPGVGSNFQDHSYIPNIGYQWGKQPPGGGWGFPGAPSASLISMIGLPVISPDNYETLAEKYEKQDPTSHLPSSYTKEQVSGYRQQQALYAKLMRSPNTTFNEIMLFGAGGAIQNLHCMSRGTVFIDPKNPEGTMQVDYRAGTNDIDLEVMAENVKFMRRFMTEGELGQYNARETSPGTNVNTTEALVTWGKGQIIPSVFHPVGTCAKMPRELGGVVDESLGVWGTKRLSIVDASMMPTTIGATTSMTVYAVAEKAADIIKARTFDV